MCGYYSHNEANIEFEFVIQKAVGCISLLKVVSPYSQVNVYKLPEPDRIKNIWLSFFGKVVPVVESVRSAK